MPLVRYIERGILFESNKVAQRILHSTFCFTGRYLWPGADVCLGFWEESMTDHKQADLADNRKSPSALVVSDIMLFRDGISAGLRRLGALDVIGTLCPDEALDYLAGCSVDVVILDTSRRRASAHAWAIKQCCPSVQIVAFGIGAPEDAIAGAESGVSAFVGEDGAIEDINDAALRALKGQSFCSPELTAILLNHISALKHNSEPKTLTSLTSREDQIASLVTDGMSNKEIAQALRISPATVKNHVHSILEKLELSRRSAIGARLGGLPRAPEINRNWSPVVRQAAST
jgi:two-component system, NarL family, nitrate/nitrite response regulator NarL